MGHKFLLNPKEHDHLCERDPGPGRSSSRLCPSSNRSPPRSSDPGGLAGDDEHGLLQRRRLARQPARGQGRGHRQGARHSPAGQEVDRGNVPGIPLGRLAVVLSAGNQSLYILEPALGGHQPYIVTDLNIIGQGYICTGIYVAIYISMCFLKLRFEIHCYRKEKKKKKKKYSALIPVQI